MNTPATDLPQVAAMAATRIHARPGDVVLIATDTMLSLDAYERFRDDFHKLLPGVLVMIVPRDTTVSAVFVNEQVTRAVPVRPEQAD